MGTPHSASAAPSCTGLTITTSPTPDTVELSGRKDRVECSELTGGLTLTFGSGAKISKDSSNTPTDEIALDIDAEGSGDGSDEAVKVSGIVAIYSKKTGLKVNRDGDGILDIGLSKGTIINAGSATTSGEVYGVHALHKGKATTTLEKGIKIVSEADITVSKPTSTSRFYGILATTSQAKTGTEIPIEIHVNGGAIMAGDVRSGQESHGVGVLHFAKGDVEIMVKGKDTTLGVKSQHFSHSGIFVRLRLKADGNITITHEGKIYANTGIFAESLPEVDGASGDITITTEEGSMIVAKKVEDNVRAYENGIYAGICNRDDGKCTRATVPTNGEYNPVGSSSGSITVVHNGSIDAAGEGLQLDNKGTGDITVTTGANSKIVSKNRGINANGSGKVMVTHGGTIDAAENGIRTISDGDVTVTLEKGSSITSKEKGIYAGSNGSGKVMITHRGTIDAAENGISTFSDGDVTVTLEKGSRITSKDRGVDAWSNGGGTVTIIHRGTIDVAKNGIQATGDGKFMIVIGAQALIQSESGVAIEMEPMDATGGDINLILEKDEDGFVGRVKGKIIQDTADRMVKFETRMGMGGAKEDLNVGDHVYSRGDRMGVYVKAFKAQLTTIEDPAGYEFKDVPGDWRLYSQRARLYEVLPSVLLGLVDLTPYGTRMAVPRRSTGNEEVMVESSKGEHVAVPGSRTGVWVRLAVRDGERMADTSTTARDVRHQSLAWDVKQTDFEAGLEVPTDDRLVLGVSAHYRQSEATVRNGGTMEASGTGVGVSLTWTDDSGLYVDGQLSYTRFFDITMVSANGAVGSVTSKGGGSGLAVGVEVGQPMTAWGLTVIPRGGLSWLSVDLDAFDEPTRIDGAGTVTPDKEQSVQGRVGVLAELAELGPEDIDGRLYASLDLEHEFSSKHAVMVAGTRLETEVKPTWVRLGVGGAMSLDGHDTTLLTGDAFYATAGSDNTDFGGGVALNIRF